MKSEVLYKQLRDDIMRWAAQKRLEKTRSKDDMEIGEMQEPLIENWSESEEQGHDWDWEAARCPRLGGRSRVGEESYVSVIWEQQPSYVGETVGAKGYVNGDHKVIFTVVTKVSF